jgi:hypothetical protein
MQPYFYPYIGYFELIYRTDRWIVFDVVQYNAKSWMNRNRILHPKEGWQYFGVPVKKSPRGTLIRDIEIEDKTNAFERILGQLSHYKKRAKYYREVVQLIRDGFLSTSSNKLVDLNISTLSTVCSYLGIDFQWSQCSAMNLDFTEVKHPGQWALEICTQLGATEYLNPPAGRDIFVPEEFEERRIDLRFMDLPSYKYSCHPFCFEESLSIVDVMMWNSVDDIRSYLARQR